MVLSGTELRQLLALGDVAAVESAYLATAAQQSRIYRGGQDGL